MALKYLHARMPGRDLVHIVPAGDLAQDADNFPNEQAFVRSLAGRVYALCGKSNVAWIVDGKKSGAPICLSCWRRR